MPAAAGNWNLPTVLLALALAGLVAAIVRKMIRDRRAGKGACSSCGSCSACGCTACPCKDKQRFPAFPPERNAAPEKQPRIERHAP